MLHHLCLIPADAADLGEQLGLFSQHPETVGAEPVYDGLCRFRADALDRAGGQVGINALFLLGQLPVVAFHLKLGAVLGVGSEGALGAETLAGAQTGQNAHHRQHLAVVTKNAGHGVAVFFILIDYRLHFAGDLL